MTQEEAEFAGKQVLNQLQERKQDRHKDYNRNIFLNLSITESFLSGYF